jgi:hypothetical protein
MLFCYPKTKHARRHWPKGYKAYDTFKPWLRDEFTFQCVFCLVRERMKDPSGHHHFAVEHLKPKKKNPTLICQYSNLVYGCLQCNSIKGEKGPVLDPCRAAYGKHFEVQSDGTIKGLTTKGRKMIRLLRLDRGDLTAFRKRYLSLERRARASPTSPFNVEWMAAILSFPDDLPDLSLSQPKKNSRPAGVASSYFAQKAAQTLPDTY